MKSQKTLYRESYDCQDLKIGDEVILLEKRWVNEDAVRWDYAPHAGHGIGGNMNSSIKRYHGWRGTTNGISTTAHGVRKVLSIEESPHKDYRDRVKIVLGPDLHPDWE